MEFKKEKIPRIIVTTIATIVIIFGTIAVVAYARGYRFNNQLGLVVKTGVLNIESNPIRTDVYLNGKSRGKTPKTIASIPEGVHQVEIIRDGYHSWNKAVEIKYEKSTPIYPHLFLIKPEVDEVFTTEDEVVNVVHDQESNYIFAITRKPLNSTDLATPQEINDYLYRVWRYNTNPNFWSAQNNPILVLESEIIDLKDFSLSLSPTSEYALVTIRRNSINGGPDGSVVIERSLLNTDQNNNPQVLDLVDIPVDPDFYWANDEEHFILKNADGLTSINISNLQQNLLVSPQDISNGEIVDPEKTEVTGTDDIVWTTDEDGYLYYIDHINISEEFPPHMQVVQKPLNGGLETILVDKIYYSESDKYLVSKDEFEEQEDLFIFTNSPDASQFAGRITNFEIVDDINMIFIETEHASYLYDVETDKYILVSVTPAKLVSISPDEEKLLLQSDDSVQIFIFDKEDADHITKLGSVTLLEKKPEELEWHGASKVIFYSEDNRFKSIDIDKANRFDITGISRNLFAQENSGDNIFTVKEDEGSLKILRIKIN